MPPIYIGEEKVIEDPWTTLSIKKSTKQRLIDAAEELAAFQDSYDVILNKLMDIYDEAKKPKQEQK
jgi:CRISPR/Cas system CSM-associated protein Csm2 small subunit